jgi:hypothetical protein
MRKDVHPRGIEPAEERLAGLVLTIMMKSRRRRGIPRPRFPCASGQRPGILSLAIRGCLEDAARAEPLFEFGSSSG